jgi:TolA-binding protein
MTAKEQAQKDHVQAKEKQAKPENEGMDPLDLTFVSGQLVQRFKLDPSSLSPHEIRRFQRTIGNQAVSQNVRESAALESAETSGERGTPQGSRPVQGQAGEPAAGNVIQRDYVDDSYQEAVATYERAERNRRLYTQAIQEFETTREMAVTGGRRDLEGRSLCYLGLSQAARRNWQAAIFAFERSLALLTATDPLRAQAQQGLSQAQGRAGIPAEEGGAEGGEAPTEASAATQNRFNQAMESYNARRFPQASQRLRALLRQRDLPEEMHARATFYYGASLYETRQWQAARQNLELARSAPGIPADLQGKCLFYLGMCDLRQSRNESALLYLEQFLATPGVEAEMATQARQALNVARGCTSPGEYCNSEYAVNFRGRRQGPGYFYAGQSAGQATIPEATRPDIAAAYQVFRRLLPLEGNISAINTWDGMVFTWGAGFAASRAQGIYQGLGAETRAFLQSNAPYRFTGSGIVINEDIRLDRHALGLISYVGENEPYQSDVLRTQFRDFLVHTYQYNRAGVAPAVSNAPENITVLAAHMNHWLPGFFEFPTELNRAVSLGGQGASETLLAAIIFKILTHNMLHARRFGRVDERGRRRLIRTGLDPINHFKNNLNQIWRRSHIDASDTAIQGYIPAFTSSSSPYFQGGALDTMPDGNLILEDTDHSNFYNFGTPLSG